MGINDAELGNVFPRSLDLFYIVICCIKLGKTSWTYTKEQRRLSIKLLLILDGNSEIGAHVRSNLDYLIFLKHLFRSRAVTNLIFFR